nr:SRPBCC family protein [Nitrosospira multiformis]
MFSLRSIFDPRPAQPVVSKASILMKGSTEKLFRYLGDDFFENYPKWSPEVKELKQIGEQPMGPGVTARQVRIDGGHRSESKFRITLYEPNRSLAFAGISEPFHCTYEIQDEGREGLVKLIFTFELLEMKVFMRPFESLIRIAAQHGAERTVRNIKNLVEIDADTVN